MPSLIPPKELDKLRRISLLDVMDKNGHKPVYRNGNNVFYRCPLPGHLDTDASFTVTVQPVVRRSTGDASLCAFNCLGCHKISGFGAIELQAALMGTPLTGNGLFRVVEQLCSDHNIKIDGVEVSSATRFRNVDPVKKVSYQECEWTPEYIKALGCRMSHHFVQSQDDEDGDEPFSGRYSYSWGRGYYDEDGQVRPDNFDPAEITRMFDVHPISCLIRPAKEGAKYSLLNEYDDANPAFAIIQRDALGNVRVKIYSPCQRERKNRWSSYIVENKCDNNCFRSSLFGDADVMRCLYDSSRTPVTSDKHHPVVTVNAKNAGGEYTQTDKFQSICICSGHRDAMQVYFHSSCHVVYPHSESSRINPALIARLHDIAENVYILFDADTAGVKAARKLSLDYLWMHNVELPDDLSGITSIRTGNPCKDAAEYFEHYRERLPRYESDMRKHFSKLLSASPSGMFFSQTLAGSKSDKAAGVERWNYQVITTSLCRFLNYSGMSRFRDQSGNSSFCMVTDNIVRVIRNDKVVGEAKRIMLDWLYSHHFSDEFMHHAILQSKTITLETLKNIPEIEMDFVASGRDYQYLFFRNTALRVSGTEIVPQSYSELPFFVYESRILPINWEGGEFPVTVEDNTDMVALEREHRQRMMAIDKGNQYALDSEIENWKSIMIKWARKLILHRPMNQQPAEFQYLYDTGRIYWRDEEKLLLAGRSLPADKRQVQDVFCISKMAALGYLMHQYHDKDNPYLVAAIDYTVDDETKDSGRCGKSIFPMLASVLVNVMSIAGQDMQTSQETFTRNFHRLDYMRDAIVNINDVSRQLSERHLYNIAEGQMNVKRLHQDEISVPSDFVPKLVLSQNRMFDTSNSSLRGRVWEVAFCDYYHIDGRGMTKRNPKMKFGRDIGIDLGMCDDPVQRRAAALRDIPEEELSDVVLFLVYCLQFYLRTLTLVPFCDTDGIRLRRLHSCRDIKDKAFIRFADKLFAINGIFGYPVASRDLLVEWFRFKGWKVSPELLSSDKLNEFRRSLSAYCAIQGIRINPDVVYSSTSDINNGLPRVTTWTYPYERNTGITAWKRARQSAVKAYYFYRVGDEPRTHDDVINRPENELDISVSNE